MQNKDVLEMLGGLAFVQFLIRFYGYGLDKGIILLTDNDESAAFVRTKLKFYLEAVEMKLNKKNEDQPLNYQMGVHVYNKFDNERNLIDFLEESSFLPVVIVGGIIPECLIGKAYIFRCNPTERDFAETKTTNQALTEWIKEHLNETKNVIRTTIKYPFGDRMEQSDDGKYRILLANIEIVRQLQTRLSIHNGSPKEEAVEKLKKIRISAFNAIKTMEYYEGEYDIGDAIGPCFLKQIAKENVSFKCLEKNIALDEIENKILYDDEYYYITEPILRKLCAPLLGSVSFLQLKHEMVRAGLVKCDGTGIQNFTKKKVIWCSDGHSERVRFVWMNKEPLMSEENLALEDIVEDKPC